MKKRQREKLIRQPRKLDALASSSARLFNAAIDEGYVGTKDVSSWLDSLLDLLQGFSLHVHVLVTGRDEVDVTVDIRDAQKDKQP